MNNFRNILRRFCRLLPDNLAARMGLLALAIVLVGWLLAGCAQVQTYGRRAIDVRQEQNDAQARATIEATCDIALGALFRELSDTERRYAVAVCAAKQRPAPSSGPLPEMLVAPER